MDYVKAITFVFDDPRWKEKVIWGTGLVFLSTLLSAIVIGVLGFVILAGYGVRLLQNVRDGEEFPLPEWDDWGGDFVRGLKYSIVGLVYAIPLFVFTIPLIIGGILTDNGGAGEFMGGTILFCGTCLMVLYGIFVFLASPGFTLAYATDEHISSGLQFTDIWHWTRTHIGQVIIAIIVVMVAQWLISFVASIVGTLLCVIGLIVTIPLSMLAYTIYQYHIFGQLAYEFPYGGFGGKLVLADYSEPISPSPAYEAPPVPEEAIEAADDTIDSSPLDESEEELGDSAADVALDEDSEEDKPM
jgi:uncharacterized protein DUF4013